MATSEPWLVSETEGPVSAEIVELFPEGWRAGARRSWPQPEAAHVLDAAAPIAKWRVRLDDFAHNWITPMEDFSNWCTHERNFQPATLDGYLNEIGYFVQWLMQHTDPIPPPHQCDRKYFRPYLQSLAALGLTAESSNKAISGLRSFYGFLEYAREIKPEQNDTKHLVRPSLQAKMPTAFSHEEVARLILAPLTYPLTTAHPWWTRSRDRAMLATFADTGLRLSELIRLDVDCIRLDAGELRVYLGKGRKPRVMPLSGRLSGILAEWLADRPRCNDRSLFPTSRRTRIGESSVKASVARYGAFVGLRSPRRKNGRVATHDLRATFLTNVWRACGDLYMVQRLAGHADPRTTAGYIRFDVNNLRNALARYEADVEGVAQ